MELKAFKEALFAKAKEKGFEQWELYCSRSTQFEARIFNGQVEQFKNAQTQGVSFRGLYDGKMGYAYSEKIENDVIETLVQQAQANAYILEEKRKANIFAGSSSYPEINAPQPLNFTVEDKISQAIKMEKAAYEADPRVVSVDYCAIINGEGESLLSNSLGLNLSHWAPIAYAYLSPRVEENGQTKTGVEVYKSYDFTKFNPEAIAKTAVKKAVAALGGSSIAAGNYSVILDKMVAADLLNSFVSAFYARSVQKGFSLLKGKCGTSIAADIVTLRDDGIYPDSLGNSPFDSEGVASKNKTMIDNGKLSTYLYNLETAMVDGVESTGNGFRPSFKGTVSTSATNFYIVPKENSLTTLFAQMSQGLYITDISGLHAGVNQISGDFSLSAEGFIVEKGQKGRPVEQITISGNFFQLLKEIKAIGNDLYFNLPSSDGTIGSPSLWIENLAVSGSVG